MVEQKKVIYEHSQIEKMLHYVNVWFLPFRWGVNTYRGCEHNCVYCNARYTHEYLGLPTGEFDYRIFVKDNAAEVLDKEFSKEKWKTKMTVNMATVTDPYQPCEGTFKITREVLEIFLKHHNSLMLTTKSDLVLRDLDILTKIAETGFLNVVITLPTTDETLRETIEPRAPSVEQRLRVIHKLHETGITTGVAAIPLLPFISDGEQDVEKLIKAVAKAGADYVIVDLLNFKGEARQRFLEFLQSYNSDLTPKYEELYQTDYCNKEYAAKMRTQANKLIRKNKVDKYSKMYSYGKRPLINQSS